MQPLRILYTNVGIDYWPKYNGLKKLSDPHVYNQPYNKQQYDLFASNKALSNVNKLTGCDYPHGKQSHTWRSKCDNFCYTETVQKNNNIIYKGVENVLDNYYNIVNEYIKNTKPSIVYFSEACPDRLKKIGFELNDDLNGNYCVSVGTKKSRIFEPHVTKKEITYITKNGENNVKKISCNPHMRDSDKDYQKNWLIVEYHGEKFLIWTVHVPVFADNKRYYGEYNDLLKHFDEILKIPNYINNCIIIGDFNFNRGSNQKNIADNMIKILSSNLTNNLINFYKHSNDGFIISLSLKFMLGNIWSGGLLKFSAHHFIDIKIIPFDKILLYYETMTSNRPPNPNMNIVKSDHVNKDNTATIMKSHTHDDTIDDTYTDDDIAHFINILKNFDKDENDYPKYSFKHDYNNNKMMYLKLNQL